MKCFEETHDNSLQRCGKRNGVLKHRGKLPRVARETDPSEKEKRSRRGVLIPKKGGGTLRNEGMAANPAHSGKDVGDNPC